MDLRQIEYIIAIEQEESISKAAEKLFITQSALNQQLLKLEKELGMPLFERKKRQMIPTVAGRIYLATAHQMIDMKEETYKIIHDIADETVGEIALAYTPERGSMMFSDLYPVFHKRYPGITFRIHEARIKKMEQLLLQKEITLACVAYATGKQNPDLEYRDFGSEYLVLALPASHPLAHLAGEESWKTLPDLDLSLLRQDYFVLPTRDTLSRELADRTFLYNNIRPKILFETGNNRTMLNMTKNQQCPVFLPQSYAQPNPDIVFFSVSPHEIWHRGVAYLKGTYLSKPEKYFIELVTNYEAEYQGQTKY